MSEIAGPELNAALVHLLDPQGREMGKASGCLLRLRDNLYLLTNWHVVTNLRWTSESERREAQTHSRWASDFDFSPWAIRVSVRIGTSQRVLRILQLQEELDPQSAGQPAFAWEPGSYLFHGAGLMPNADLVCLHLASDISQQESDLRTTLQQSVRFGYSIEETGIGHGLSISDPVFVVGYPVGMGRNDFDPPIWTSGTVASDPLSDWDGPRFLIDSRTRPGQSGSAVIAYAPERRGLAAQHQLLGVYSGRIDESADIGSVWPVTDLVDSLQKHGVVSRFDGSHTRHHDVLLR